MRVQATVNLGTNDYPSCPLMEGEAADVPDTLGALMVARNHAIQLPEPAIAKLVEETHPVVAEPAPVVVKAISTPEVPAVKPTKAAHGRKF